MSCHSQTFKAMFSRLFATKNPAPAAVPEPAAEPATQEEIIERESTSELANMDFEVNIENVDMHLEEDETVATGVLASEWNGSGGCSHADIASSSDFVPPRYVHGCSKLAAERWAATLSWRATHGMDNLLSLPRLHFHTIKAHWSHFFCGRTPSDNRLVVYEHVGGLKRALAELETQHNISFQDVMTHYLYLTEYQWSILDTQPYDDDDSTLGQMIKVLDFQGLTLSDCRNTDLRTFVTWTLRTIGRHYPERCGVIYLINTPGWFNTFWTVIQRLVSDVTRQKIRICPTSKEFGPKLKAWMGGAAFLPSCMGGPVDVNGTTALCADEAKLHAHVDAHSTS
ncbi:Aste57867_1446 [Aphanomyces stellatus]|uniref:Aste57867_1446 protein n=1 Tax=Aphanomyces stellatus TaxID=120398 RepID=A0A485KAC2_9STRA|nr:hypothetical protein As57867_001445 [Aphanomyces stellatus]VFT78663.1 Aste57867_1446 [Aphanomyces stellatus]